MTFSRAVHTATTDIVYVIWDAIEARANPTISIEVEVGGREWTRNERRVSKLWPHLVVLRSDEFLRTLDSSVEMCGPTTR